FIRSLIERPFATGAVTPSGRILARTMARYVEPEIPGPVVELGPGTGPVTEALVEHGVDPARLILVEFNPRFCALLGARFPRATAPGPATRAEDQGAPGGWASRHRSGAAVRARGEGMHARERLIVALDLDDVREAEALIERLGDAVVFYKIGYQLAFAGGLPL